MGRFAPFRMPPVAEDTGMHSQNISLIACRLWAFLFAGIAMAATAIGALALYWAVFDIPEDLAPQFEDDLPSQARFFMAVLVGAAIVVDVPARPKPAASTSAIMIERINVSSGSRDLVLRRW